MEFHFCAHFSFGVSIKIRDTEKPKYLNCECVVKKKPGEIATETETENERWKKRAHTHSEKEHQNNEEKRNKRGKKRRIFIYKLQVRFIEKLLYRMLRLHNLPFTIINSSRLFFMWFIRIYIYFLRTLSSLLFLHCSMF